jgi:hypothetical protein
MVDENLEKRMRIMEANISDLQQTHIYNMETREIMRESAVIEKKMRALSIISSISIFIVAVIYLIDLIFFKRV